MLDHGTLFPQANRLKIINKLESDIYNAEELF